jgi:heme exporter protein CcmD
MMRWLLMGGYWPYLWPSYLLTLLVVVLNIFFARRSLRAARAEVRRRLQMQRSNS